MKIREILDSPRAHSMGLLDTEGWAEMKFWAMAPLVKFERRYYPIRESVVWNTKGDLFKSVKYVSLN
jgi:hypothetical protein